MSTVSTSFEGSKYTIQFNDKNGELELLRNGYRWEEGHPKYSKMLIHIMYEVSRLRKIVSDISYDFDPDVRLGPPCGPEMLERIKEYERDYNIDLRFVEDISK